jgi:hypothetical protein
MRGLILAAAIGLSASGAQAAVTARADTEFSTSYREVVTGTPAQVYAAIGRVGAWWNPSHTYSGDAAKLTLSLTPGGCLCEALPGGGVQHGTVVMAWSERATVRLQAALGPLQSLTTNAVLTIAANTAPEGKVEITATYRVIGGAGLGKVADGVDAVVGEQIARLARYVGTGKPS